MLTNKYPYQPLERESVNGSRMYAIPDGSRLASVTTILDITKDDQSKQALARWRASIGNANADEITRIAASRGTRMHKFLEDYVETGILNLAGTNPYSIQARRMAEQIIKHGLANATELWGSEVALYYSGLYAGTTDLV